MSILHVIILAIVQGLAELLPVSSSAHVIVVEKLLGLNPSSPEMTLLLVMLHTGTMFAVIVYFWKQWVEAYFRSIDSFTRFAIRVVLATAVTGLLGEGIIKLVEKVILKDTPKAQIEDLFSHLEWIAPALAAAGVIILIAGLRERQQPERTGAFDESVTLKQAGIIGAVQGLALPFRGFSRSGSTISAGMLAGVQKVTAEAFSFALAVVLTPLVVGREWMRFTNELHEQHPGTGIMENGLLFSLLGALVAFAAGIVALRWLSSWLEEGRWYLFGIYCLVAAFGVFLLYLGGY
jgi:undecaprenyl-diphosphatase